MRKFLVLLVMLVTVANAAASEPLRVSWSSHNAPPFAIVEREQLSGGVIFDIDPEFANSDEWYEAIPEDVRPAKDQPFYHLLAENAEGSYIAYVSQQNLVTDESEEPIDHPAIAGLFGAYQGGKYTLRPRYLQ